MISVTCQYGASDTLEVRPYDEPKVVASLTTRNSRCVTLGPDDARKVRDALTAALDAHDEKQRARRERWDAAGVLQEWKTSVGRNSLRISDDGGGCVAHISTDDCGASVTATQLDEVIAKLTAIRDAHNERVASNEAR